MRPSLSGTLGFVDESVGSRDGGSLSIRDHLERLMPPGGRARRLVGWGVVAWTLIGGGILIWVLARAFDRIAGVFPYLVVAALVVFILNPLVRRLARLGVQQRLAATVVFVVSVVVMAALLSLAIPILVDQTRHLMASSPGLLRKGGSPFERLAHSHNPLLHRAGQTISAWIQTHAGNAPKALRTLTSAGLQLAHFGLVLLIGSFLGFLLLVSLPETTRGFLAMVPPGNRDRLAPTLEEVKRIVSGYVRARLIVSAVVGLLATIGFWAIHMPFWLVLGVIVGVANLIPMLGSWIGGIPVAMVALVTKPPSFLLVVLVVVVIAHTVDGYILSPIVLRETTNLHPIVILLAVLVGAELLGFWGILAAIPVAGILAFGLREWIIPRFTGMVPPEEPPPMGDVAMQRPVR
jgi:predicted PurR-regulated permease PerM